MTKEKRSWMVWSHTLCWSSCFVGHLVRAVRRPETEGGAVSMRVSFHRNFDDFDEVASALNEFGIPCAMLQGSVGQCLVNKSQHKYQWLWSVKHLAFQYIHMWQTYFICEYQSQIQLRQSPTSKALFSQQKSSIDIIWYHLISSKSWFEDIHQNAAVWGAQESSVIGKTIHSRKPSSYCSPWLSQLQAWQGKLLIPWSLNITENHWTSIWFWSFFHIFPLSFFFLSSCFSIFKWIKRSTLRRFLFCQRYQPHGGESCDLLTSHVGSQRGSCRGLWDAGGFVPDFHHRQLDLFDLVLEGFRFFEKWKEWQTNTTEYQTDKSC